MQYGSEHGSNMQSESSADGNIEEENNDVEASTETCTVIDGTKVRLCPELHTFRALKRLLSSTVVLCEM